MQKPHADLFLRAAFYVAASIPLKLFSLIKTKTEQIFISLKSVKFL
jgi:hypothetical protein